MCKRVSCLKDAEDLREDLIKLNKWSKDWQMQFNADKWIVLHLGKENQQYEYMLGNNKLRKSTIEKDLGIIVDSSCKFSEQCSSVIKKANSTLGMIKKNITHKSKDIIIRLYKALVRPKLEFCVQAWRPYLRKDIDGLEKVQRRATRLIHECRGLSYEDRLKITGLTTLEDRRTRGDMIQVFKLMQGIDTMDYEKFFNVADSSRTRGHRYKLVKNRSRLELRKNYFSQRVVNCWNALPASVVEAVSVNSFKNRYNEFVSSRFVQVTL